MTTTTEAVFQARGLTKTYRMALVVPGIFLGVAAFLLNVVISRTVGTQREQIAALKAFGYTRWEVTLHYLKFVGLIVLAGVAVGVAVGAWLGREMTAMYTAFFRFPVFEFTLDGVVVLLAVGISAGAGVLGTFAAVRRAAALPPAEAMKPEPPATYSRTLVERLGLHRVLSPAVRMMVRHIERRKVKTALTTVGIALAVAVVILGSFGKDAIDHVMVAQFSVTQRQDVAVGFAEPSSHAALYELEEQRVNVIADFTDPLDKRKPLGDAYRVEARIVISEGEAVKVPAGALFRRAPGGRVSPCGTAGRN